MDLKETSNIQIKRGLKNLNRKRFKLVNFKYRYNGFNTICKQENSQ